MNAIPDHNNTFEPLYARGECIRRFPDEDVVALCARRRGFKVAVDLGTGTGRNLLPMLLAARDQGFVVASDLAASGLASIESWLTQMNAAPVSPELLPTDAQEAYRGLGLGLPHTLLRVKRRPSEHLDPLSLAVDGEQTVYVILVCAPMQEPWLADGSVDLIVNRGSIFYLPRQAMPRCVAIMHALLRSGGTCFVSFKSERDSRYQSGSVVGDSTQARIQTHGAQVGLRLEFSSREEICELMQEFADVEISHVEIQRERGATTLADWVVQARKGPA